MDGTGRSKCEVDPNHKVHAIQYSTSAEWQNAYFQSLNDSGMLSTANAEIILNSDGVKAPLVMYPKAAIVINSAEDEALQGE